MLRCSRADVSLSDIMLLLDLKLCQFSFPCRKLRAQFGELFLLVLLEVAEGLALFIAIHGVALHQDIEVDLGGVKLGAIDTGELALVAEHMPVPSTMMELRLTMVLMPRGTAI